MAIVFSYHGNNLAELQQNYARFSSSEFCESDVCLEGARPHHMKIDKILFDPVSLMHVVKNTTCSFRRSWQHIRHNKAGVRVISIVRNGMLKISRSQTSYTVKAGECAIIDSNQPYYAQAITEDAAFDVVTLVVPLHVFVSHLPGAMSLDRPFPVTNPVIWRLIDLLLEEGEAMNKATATPLVMALLEAMGDTIDSFSLEFSQRRQRVVDRRLSDITNYIMKNFTNPDLTYDEVANRCGISPRYLCHVLKANDTSFSELVWEQRLSKAREWLLVPHLKEHSIQEVAFMTGFKSAAHFSRMFKERYDCTPKTYRTTGTLDPDREAAAIPLLAARLGAPAYEMPMAVAA